MMRSGDDIRANAFQQRLLTELESLATRLKMRPLLKRLRAPGVRRSAFDWTCVRVGGQPSLDPLPSLGLPEVTEMIGQTNQHLPALSVHQTLPVR
jgi:hypothetical protein